MLRSLPALNIPKPAAPLFESILAGNTSEESGYRMPSNPRADLVQLHLNENLFEIKGDLPQIVIDEKVISRYPVEGCTPLVRALAEKCNVEHKAVSANGGASAVLNAIFSLFANSDAVAILPSPTWAYYHQLLDGLGVQCINVRQNVDDRSFCYDVDALASQSANVGASLIILTSPNNPTGNKISYAEVKEIALACPGSLIVLDEAYHGFSAPDPMPVGALIESCPNIVVVRSFSKALGMAGLRVGFALAGTGAQQLLRRLPVPFGLAGYAQELAIARIQDEGYQIAVRNACSTCRELLYDRLAKIPHFRPYASSANFILVRTPPGQAKNIRDYLASKGYLVKVTEEFEQVDHLRITVAKRSVMERVSELLAEWIAK